MTGYIITTIVLTDLSLTPLIDKFGIASEKYHKYLTIEVSKNDKY
jgi:hypothetical protein